MNTMNKADIHELNEKEMKMINGGGLKGFGWFAVVTEVVDVVTSNGDNLREAYQNGYEAGKR